MIEFLRFASGLVADLLRSRGSLVADALLRQQLIVAERKIVGRPRWRPRDRYAMALAARFAPAWRTVTMLVQPATSSAGIASDFAGSRLPQSRMTQRSYW